MPLVMVEWWGWRQLDTVGDSWTRDDWKRSRVTTIWIICSLWIQCSRAPWFFSSRSGSSRVSMHHQGQWRLCLGRADAGATRSSQGSVHFLWHGPALEEVLGGRSTAPTGRDYIRSPSHVASLGQILGTCMLWNFAKIDGLDAWRMSLLNIILRFTKILFCFFLRSQEICTFFSWNWSGCSAACLDFLTPLFFESTSQLSGTGTLSSKKFHLAFSSFRKRWLPAK